VSYFRARTSEDDKRALLKNAEREAPSQKHA
jgi:hypothetical protein